MSTIYPTPEFIPRMSLTNKVIVLDLDQTLIATQDSIESLSDLGIYSNPDLLDLRKRTYRFDLEDMEQPGKGTKYPYWGIIRPHVHEFLIFCFSYFKIVAVWSAGQRQYVESIVDYVFRDLPRPHIVLTHDDIVYDDVHLYKPLSKLISQHPAFASYLDLSKIYALDDNSYTFIQNPDNGVLIPEYNPSLNIDAFRRDDPTLLQFRYWLVQPHVLNARDVRDLDKSDIFSTSISAYLKKPAVALFR